MPSLQRAGTRPLVNLLLFGLTTLGTCWAVLAGYALWRFAATVEGSVAWVAVAPSPRLIHNDSVEVALPRPALPSPQAQAVGGRPGPGGFHTDLGAPLHDTAEQHSDKPTAGGSPAALTYRGATCSGVFVYIVTLSEHSPGHSAVSFATKDSARASFARPGEAVGPWKVLAITDDWTGVNPVVWLVQKDEVCRTGLTGNPLRARLALEQLQKKRSRKTKRRRR